MVYWEWSQNKRSLLLSWSVTPSVPQARNTCEENKQLQLIFGEIKTNDKTGKGYR